jgi:hypothetical protein
MSSTIELFNLDCIIGYCIIFSIFVLIVCSWVLYRRFFLVTICSNQYESKCTVSFCYWWAAKLSRCFCLCLIYAVECRLDGDERAKVAAWSHWISVTPASVAVAVGTEKPHILPHLAPPNCTASLEQKEHAWARAWLRWWALPSALHRSLTSKIQTRPILPPRSSPLWRPTRLTPYPSTVPLKRNSSLQVCIGCLIAWIKLFVLDWTSFWF